jgi:predicted acylesterase/phospholipase RssA
VDAARFLDEFRPFRRGELALARRLVRDPEFLLPPERDVLRWALRLCQLSTVGAEPDGLVDRIGSLRLRMLQFLAPVLPTDVDALDAAPLVELAPRLAELVESARARALDGLCSEEELDREIATKRVALVLGGAAGSGYAYAGALSRLDDLNLPPAYMVGCSIGAILAVLRARSRRFDVDALYGEVRALRLRGALRPVSLPRFGLPAALRLDLRGAIGSWFAREGGGEIRLCDLVLPVDTVATGVGPGALGRPRAEYARLVDAQLHGAVELAALGGRALARVVSDLVALAMSRQVLVPIVFGADRDTSELPAIDAAGFSAAIPAILQYEPAPRDDRALHILEGIFSRHELAALVDGVIVSTIPARYAWEAIEGGRIGTRHVAIVALDALASRRGANLVLAPFVRVMASTAHRDAAFWDLHVPFRGGPSILEIFPREGELRRVVARAEREFDEPARVLRELCAPVPRWRALRERMSRLASARVC